MIKISVIIPVYNGEKTISKCLESLLNQTFSNKNYEIIVIDDGSTDNTVNIVNQIKSKNNLISYYYQENLGASTARNYGAKLSNFDCIAFIDSDAYADKNWVENISIVFSDINISACGGVVDNFNNDFFSNLNHIAEFSEYYEKKVKIIRTIPSANLAFRKTIFDKIGGFDKDLSVGEDADINYRLSKFGYKLYYYSDIIVYHDTTSNYRQFIKKQYNFGFKAFEYRKKNPGSNYQFVFNKRTFLFLVPLYLLRNILMYFTRKYFYKHTLKSILGIPFLIIHRTVFWYGVGKFIFRRKS